MEWYEPAGYIFLGALVLPAIIYEAYLIVRGRREQIRNQNKCIDDFVFPKK